MVVNNKMPVNSVKEFIAYAKERPGKLTFGSTGVGAMDYLAGELFMQKTSTSMVHVPYRGGPLALNDLIGGHLDTIIEVYPVVMEQIRSGQIKGLAVSSATRLPSLPDLPTFEEAGVPGIVLTGWLGIYGPPKMPEDVRKKLGEAIVEVVNQPDIQKKFRDIGFEPMIGQGVKEFTAHHEAEVKRWVAFLTELGLRK
jgi:tripartite-type tricarboxylate transporter receptor subunit TctC